MEYLTSGITSNFDMYIMQDDHINAYVDTGFRTVFTSGLNNFTDSLEVLEENYLKEHRHTEPPFWNNYKL